MLTVPLLTDISTSTTAEHPNTPPLLSQPILRELHLRSYASRPFRVLEAVLTPCVMSVGSPPSFTPQRITGIPSGRFPSLNNYDSPQAYASLSETISNLTRTSRNTRQRISPPLLPPNDTCPAVLRCRLLSSVSAGGGRPKQGIHPPPSGHPLRPFVDPSFRQLSTPSILDVNIQTGIAPWPSYMLHLGEGDFVQRHVPRVVFIVTFSTSTSPNVIGAI